MDYNYLAELLFPDVTETPEDMEKVLVELRKIRDSWKQVMKLAKDPRI